MVDILEENVLRFGDEHFLNNIMNNISFDQYEVIEKIYSNEKSVVYKGNDMNGRSVAVKLTNLEDITVPFSEILKGMAVIQRLTSSNKYLVTMYDYFLCTSEDVTCLVSVLQFVEPLNEHFMPGSSKEYEMEIVRVGRDVCNGLQSMHDEGIIHRDIKPENIYYSAIDKNYLIGDLEYSAIFRNIKNEVKIFTPSYMAPEVFLGQPYDHRSDIYSLGLTLYLLIESKGDLSSFTENTQIDGNSAINSRIDLLKKRISGDQSFIRQGIIINKHLRSVIDIACRYDVGERYAKIDDFRRKLEIVLYSGDEMPHLSYSKPNVKRSSGGLILIGIVTVLCIGIAIPLLLTLTRTSSGSGINLNHFKSIASAVLIFGIVVLVIFLIIRLLFWSLNRPVLEDHDNTEDLHHVAAAGEVQESIISACKDNNLDTILEINRLAETIETTIAFITKYSEEGNQYAAFQLAQFRKMIMSEAETKAIFANRVIDALDSACLKLLSNSMYGRETHENDMNDYIRDMMSGPGRFYILDQTRRGMSENQNDAGELDMMILQNDEPFAIIEALRLKSLAKKNLEAHIQKLLVNYDSVGLKHAFLLIYYVGDDEEFFKNLNNWLLAYQYPFSFQSSDVICNFANLKKINIALKHTDIMTTLHVYVLHVTNSRKLKQYL